MARVQLSENFFLDEFTRSATAARHGIVIKADRDVQDNLRWLCEFVLQPLRDALGPVSISSGYRPKRVNQLVGGSASSSHLNGCAADITVAGRTPFEVCNWIAASELNYDQNILEFQRWTHISMVTGWRSFPRYQDLTSYKQRRTLRNPKTVYLAGIHELGSIDDPLKIYT